MTYVLGLGREAVMMTLWVAAPMLGFGLLVGLLVSIFQAATQIHEMTLTFIPKIVAVALALLFFLQPLERGCILLGDLSRCRRCARRVSWR